MTSPIDLAREALQAVAGAMLNGGDGAVGDFGWNITKLNAARPLIRQALASLPEQEGVAALAERIVDEQLEGLMIVVNDQLPDVIRSFGIDVARAAMRAVQDRGL